MRTEEEIKKRLQELSKVHCNFKITSMTRNKAYKEILVLKWVLNESEKD